MANMNIRNIPEGLLRRLKVEAAEKGETLRGHVIAILEGVARGGKGKSQ